MTDQPLIAATNPRRCLVVDATPEVQKWVDELCERQLAHPDPDQQAALPDGLAVITVATLWRTVDSAFSTEDQRWSIAESGLPVLEDPEVFAGPADAGNPIRRWWCAIFGC